MSNLIPAGPLGRRQDRVAVSWQLTCPVCGQELARSYPYQGPDCGHRESLLASVGVDEVAEAALELAGSRDRPGSRASGA